MERGEIGHIFLLLTPVIALAVRQTVVQEESLPDLGNYEGAAMIPYWRSVLDLTYRQYIQFAVKGTQDAALLFSERHANTINYTTDFDYVMFTIGGWWGDYSIIRVGIMTGDVGRVNTSDILDSSQFINLWISWSNSTMRIGHGLEVGSNVFMKKPYPAATTEIKYLALFNGWGHPGSWRLYPGM